MRIAVEAITNKSIEELSKDGKEEAQEVKKKSCSSIIQRLRHFWSAIVGCRKDRPHGYQ
jgi:hypothetical protein